MDCGHYLSSRPATRIQQDTAAIAPINVDLGLVAGLTADVDAVACSLENPESCEACQ